MKYMFKLYIIPHLFGEVCHHVVEALLINEMLVNFVLFGSDILWKWFSATEDLEQLLLITLLIIL